MRIRDIIEKQKGTARSETVSIVALALSMSKEEVFMRFEQEVDESSCLHIDGLLSERMRGKPFAYLAQGKEFFSENFYVDERVLIPRPETEMLVEEALEILEKQPEILNILDMGTGSGAIGLTLAKKTSRYVVCADISLDALHVAQQNRNNLGVIGGVHLVCSNLFSGFGGIKFDMILANLPYVASEEWDALMTDVKDYEPRKALDGGAGGVAVYKRFIRELPHYLKKNGYVLCEVGSGEQAKELREMFRTIGINVVVKNDLSGKERVLIGSWTSLS